MVGTPRLQSGTVDPPLKRRRTCQEVEQPLSRTIWTCTCPSLLLSQRCQTLTDVDAPVGLPLCTPKIAALSHYRRIAQSTPADSSSSAGHTRMSSKGSVIVDSPTNKHPPGAPGRQHSSAELQVRRARCVRWITCSAFADATCRRCHHGRGFLRREALAVLAHGQGHGRSCVDLSFICRGGLWDSTTTASLVWLSQFGVLLCSTAIVILYPVSSCLCFLVVAASGT